MPLRRNEGLLPRRLMSWLLVTAAMGLAIWALYDPRPYVLCMVLCAISPIAAIWLTKMSGGTIILSGNDKDKRPNSFSLMFLPALALGARALSDYHLADWQNALIAAVCVSLLLNCLIIWASGFRADIAHMAITLVLLVAGFSYGYGLVTFLNVLPDPSPGVLERVIIRDKVASAGRLPSYDLNLAPWSLSPKGGNEEVSADLYRTVAAGEIACIRVHPGTLGLRWYEITACPATPPK